jgi:hypothetical protein
MSSSVYRLYQHSLTIEISPTEFRIQVTPDTDKPDPRITSPTQAPFLTAVQFVLHIILPPTYPEVVPELSLSLSPSSPRSTIPKDQYPEILSHLTSAADENLGMAMIFTLVSILKETLEEMLVSAETKAKEAARIAAEREKQKLIDEVEGEIKTLRRTPVTYELFIEWKDTFDKWKEDQMKKGNDVENVRGRNREKENRMEGRLNGREVFERMKVEQMEGFEEGEEDGLVQRRKSEEEEEGEEEVRDVTERLDELKVEE